MAKEPQLPPLDEEAYPEDDFGGFEEGDYDEDFDEDEPGDTGWRRRALAFTVGILLLGGGGFWLLTSNALGNIPVIGPLLTQPSPIPGSGPFAAPGGYGRVRVSQVPAPTLAPSTAPVSNVPPPSQVLDSQASPALQPPSAQDLADQPASPAPAVTRANPRHGKPTRPPGHSKPRTKVSRWRRLHPTARAATPAQPPIAGSFALQIGVFAEQDHAQNLVNSLQDRGFQAHVVKAALGRRTIYRVLVGSYANRGEAEQASRDLRGQSFPAIVLGR